MIFERDERGWQIRKGLEDIASALRWLGFCVAAGCIVIAFAVRFAA